MIYHQTDIALTTPKPCTKKPSIKAVTVTSCLTMNASFSKKCGYPDSAVTTGKHSAQEIDRETALQFSQNKETDRIPFTLTYHPQNLAIKNVILKNFKILRNDPETKHMFSLPPLISFKRDKNLGNFLVRSALEFNDQPGTFTCKRTQCKTCLFLSNMVQISGPNRSVKVTDHFTCITTNVIYCITSTLCKKIYIGETGRRLGKMINTVTCTLWVIQCSNNSS